MLWINRLSSSRQVADLVVTVREGAFIEGGRVFQRQLGKAYSLRHVDQPFSQ